jgi:hypothetical protein
MSSDPIDREPEDESNLVGAADIVAEFTALRHELKLQVRAGRDLTAGLEGLVDGCLDRRLGIVAERLSRLETALQSVVAGTPARLAAAGSTEAIRPLAMALSEVEESLERAVIAIATEAETITASATDTDESTARETADAAPPEPAAAWDSCLAESSWLVRTLAAGLVGRLRRHAIIARPPSLLELAFDRRHAAGESDQRHRRRRQPGRHRRQRHHQWPRRQRHPQRWRWQRHHGRRHRR